MRPTEVLKKLKELSTDINDVIKATTALGDIDAQIEYQDTPEDRFLRCEIVQVLEQLQLIARGIEYLNRPVVAEGKLRLNHSDRYELVAEDGEVIREYSSGAGIEVLIYDADTEDYSWIKSRIEHDGERYYLYGHKDLESLGGLSARVRAV